MWSLSTQVAPKNESGACWYGHTTQTLFALGKAMIGLSGLIGDRMMGLLNSLRRRVVIGRPAELATFLDRQAAFLVQKCIFEYSRARSGVLSPQLFKEAAFKAAIEDARWRNYPLCLENVVLMVEHALRPAAEASAPAMREGLIALACVICRKYPLPVGMQADFWARAEKQIARRIRQASLSPPRPVKDIPHDTAERFFASLPIHADLTSFDFELVTNNIRVNLCRAYEDFVAVADRPALIAALTAAPAPRSVGEPG